MKFWLCTIVAMLSLGVPASENLLKNGDFAGNNLLPWQSPQRSGGAKNLHSAADGKLTVTGDPANKYNSFVTLTQDLPALNPQEKYLLSARVRAGIANPKGKAMRISIREIGAGDKTLAYSGFTVDLGDKTWRNYHFLFIPRKDAEKFAVYLITSNLETGDTLEVDDIEFSVAPGIKPKTGNAVVNGDFEYFQLDPWGCSQQDGVNRIHTISGDTRYGKQCLAVTGAPNNKYNKFITLIQDLPKLDQNTEYVLSARVRAGLSVTTGKEFRICVREINAQGATLCYTGFPVNLTDDTWKYYEKIFKPHPHAVKFQLYVISTSLDSGDTVYVDDVKLAPAGDAGAPFDPKAIMTPKAVSRIERDGFQAEIDSGSGLLYSLSADGKTVQPGAKFGAMVTIERDGQEYRLDGKNSPSAGFSAEAKYDVADGMFREVVTVKALQNFTDPLKIGVRHGFDSADWKNLIGALRPLRVLPATASTLFSFSGDTNDLNPGILDDYQHVAYPLVILESDTHYLLAGSRNMDEFVTLAPNHPAGYASSLQRNPKTVKKGDQFRFETNWKLFPRSQFMLRDVWRFYQEKLQTANPELTRFLPPRYPEEKRFYPGVFGSHTYFMKSREDRLPPGANIWFYSWHDNIHERYPVAGSWYSAGNNWKKLQADELRDYMAKMQKERGFNLIMYFRQLANLRERERGAFPESWYKREPGGALHLYGGGYTVTLPAEVAKEVGYDTIPWGQHNFANPDFRKFYLKELFTAIDFYHPRAIGWDMGSDLDEFSVMAETYDRLRKRGHHVKVVANESAGPTQAYADMIMLENGLLGGKSAYDFEVARAFTTAVVCLERFGLFQMAFDANLHGRKTWLNSKGLAENKRYLDNLLKRRPELRNNRVEAARLCQLRASLYDLALGASPGYMEEAAPVPPALIRFAGEINGLFGVNRSFAVMLPNRNNIDNEKSVSAWIDAGSFRLAAFNDVPGTGKFEVRLDRAYFESQHWTLKDFQGAHALTVSPEGEKAASVRTSDDGKFITLHFELPGFSALLLNCDKMKAK